MSSVDDYWNRLIETDPPIWTNDLWAVTAYGIELRRGMPYPIPKEDLLELSRRGKSEGVSEWAMHLAEKTWVDIPEFLEAFEKGLEIHFPGQDRIDLEKTVAAATAKWECTQRSSTRVSHDWLRDAEERFRVYANFK
jgi:hypothetical protein